MRKALGTLLGNQGWSGSFEGHQKLHVKKCDYFTLREHQDFFVNPRFSMYKTFVKIKIIYEVNWILAIGVRNLVACILSTFCMT